LGEGLGQAWGEVRDGAGAGLGGSQIPGLGCCGPCFSLFVCGLEFSVLGARVSFSGSFLAGCRGPTALGPNQLPYYYFGGQVLIRWPIFHNWAVKDSE
jgi:hypothetical protein